MSQVISVIVPTFNRAYCLAETLESALNQTHQAVELIVVDDGSTDGTAELMAQRFAHDPRVRYVRQANTGVSGARNHGMRIARGDFLAFLDSDDLWHPRKLELQLAVLHAFPEAGMVWSDMCCVDEHNRVIANRYLREMYSTYKFYPEPLDLFQEGRDIAPDASQFGVTGPVRAYFGQVFSKMVLGSLVHTSTVLLRRERWDHVRTFREDLRYCGEDFDFHLRTCKAGPVAFLDLPTIVYQRGRPDQLTRPEYKVHSARNFLRTIEPVLEREQASLDVPKDRLDDVLADGHGWLGYRLLESGERTEAARHLVRSLTYRPSPRMAGYLALTLVPSDLASGVRRLYRETKARVAGLSASTPQEALAN